MRRKLLHGPCFHHCLAKLRSCTSCEFGEWAQARNVSVAPHEGVPASAGRKRCGVWGGPKQLQAWLASCPSRGQQPAASNGSGASCHQPLPSSCPPPRYRRRVARPRPPPARLMEVSAAAGTTAGPQAVPPQSWHAAHATPWQLPRGGGRSKGAAIRCAEPCSGTAAQLHRGGLYRLRHPYCPAALPCCPCCRLPTQPWRLQLLSTTVPPPAANMWLARAPPSTSRQRWRQGTSGGGGPRPMPPGECTAAAAAGSTCSRGAGSSAQQLLQPVPAMKQWRFRRRRPKSPPAPAQHSPDQLVGHKHQMA